MDVLTLDPKPTFSVKVPIPVHGADPVDVLFEFKHMTVTGYAEWSANLKGRKDTDVVLEIVQSWQLDDELNAENVDRLLDNYAGAAHAIFSTYRNELFQARRKN